MRIRGVLLLVWWFAVIDAAGSIVFFEHRTYAACRVVQHAYRRIASVTVSDCRPKSADAPSPPTQGGLTS